jgi:replication factor C subunit 2/4
VCDQPHPTLVGNIIRHCSLSALEEAHKALKGIWDLGYSSSDIITTFFRVAKNFNMPEFLKLLFIKVRNRNIGA